MRPQETRSVPLTPNMTVEEYFASERLGFSNYGAMFQRGRSVTWYFLISRVLSKSSDYYSACLESCMEYQGMDGITAMSEWSDGPSQMKSGASLGQCLVRLDRYRSLKRIERSFFCAKHGKGPWDAHFGICAALIREAAKERELRSLEDVVEVLGAWGREQERREPDGPKMARVTPESLQGVNHSMCFTFEKNDKRGNVCSVGHDKSSLNYCNYRNCILSGRKPPVSEKRLQKASGCDGTAEPEEPDLKELGLATQD